VARKESPANGPATSATRRYFYTPDLRLLAATYDDSASVWEPVLASSAVAKNFRDEFVWFGDRPIAQIAPATGASAIRYTFADHLGTPLLQTDSGGRILWRVEYEPFGNVHEVRAGVRNSQPLRFPGQDTVMAWDGGAEENYNIFRWYRTGWGRYTQADPLGVLGGDNLFQYAAADPLSNTDPLGLTIYRCFRPFRNPRTRALALYLDVVWHWSVIQPPVPGVRGCLQHEYLYNSDISRSYGFDPKEFVQESGNDLCYQIPEPLGSCVWDNFPKVAGSMERYNLLTNNCQTTINKTIQKCKSCNNSTKTPAGPKAPANCVFVDGQQICSSTGF
jgi:RHS repeat-associated protein